jgi:predicted CoA-substrate-specific enzyme activase
MYLGIDIGSSSSKVAILDESRKLVGHAVVNMGTGTDGLDEALKQAMSQAGSSLEDIKYTIATGYGRLNCPLADDQITEISCHARGVSYLLKGVNTIIDIGGQDSKVIRMDDNGKIQNFTMNEKCAAGTGRFLEVMSRVLACPIDKLSDLASQSTEAISISSMCTVFAESEVISQLSKGAKRADVARGAHVSVAKRIAGMCNRVGVEPKIIMTGGVALNKDMVEVMGKELNQAIESAPHPQIAGAIGAADFAYAKYQEKGKRTYG